METFNYFDLFEHLRDAQLHGVAIAPKIINEEFREKLLEEIKTHEYKELKTNTNGVIQEFSVAAYKEIPSNYPLLRKLRARTEQLICFGGIRSLIRWKARETSIQKYKGETNKISAHRDLKRHKQVIVIFNIAGSCDFEILKNVNGPVTQLVQPKPGDMVILRGLGMGVVWEEGMWDNRPYHRVSGNTSEDPERISIGFRDNDALHLPDPTFYSFNQER